jgi:diguanylate cyclase (GGDEF)-like protein/PAS domain S-box-containing protein
LFDLPLAALLESNPLGIAVWRAHGPDPADLVLEYVNAKAGKALGIDLEPMLGMRMADAFPNSMEGKVGERACDPVWRAAVGGVTDSSEFAYSDSKVSWRWLRHDYVPLGDSLMVVYYENVTERRAETALAALGAGVVIHAPDTSILLANPKACELLGVQEVGGRLANDPSWVFLDEDMSPLSVDRYPVVRVIAGAQVRGQLVGIRRPDGSLIWVEVNALPRFDDSDELIDVSITFSEVTTRETQRRDAVKLNDHLLRLSVTDPLTGLKNRRGTFREAERMLANAARHHESLIFVVVDVDDLKPVNDRGGHEQGDELLRRMAGACQQELRESDLAGRIGGDEFLILLPHADLLGGESIAERIRSAAGTSGVKASFGGAAVRSGESVDELLRRADQALYQAKKAGGNRVVMDR